MFSKTLLSAVAGLATICLATTAEARRGGGGSYEFMEYVADFKAPAEATDGKQLYLCHLIKDYHALFVPLYYQSEGYVLAENRCDTENYYDFTAAALAEAKAAGALPADLPDAPSISLARRIPTVILGLVILFGILAKFRRKNAA
ncbi:MAG: hypothetical protein HC844_18505 [Tabrizicola sp.]|nr:hypothetical protein [Tabrizicola sp.]